MDRQGKSWWVAVGLLGVAVSCMGPAARAQDWGSMVRSLAGEAAQKAIDREIDGPRSDTAAQGQAANPMLHIDSAYDFAPGPVTLFEQNFASTPPGAMPADLKTNGSGQVVTVAEFPGHWLELRDGSSYKLRPPMHLPARFTIEFDLIPVAEQISDLDAFSFGFAHDNSAGAFINDAYNNNAINCVALEYINGGAGDISVSSSATRYSNHSDIDWRDYANRVTHVAIAVDGNLMTVYLDHMKIADAQLFEHNVERYFYFSASLGHHQDARLLVGNLRIGGFQQPVSAQQTAQQAIQPGQP